jgi:hypothetical protein
VSLHPAREHLHRIVGDLETALHYARDAYAQSRIGVENLSWEVSYIIDRLDSVADNLIKIKDIQP